MLCLVWTSNPLKYKMNAERNRLHAIEQERRKIQVAAIHMAQRLAAIHDPTGASFNVKPVTTDENGRVRTLESLERERKREAQKEAESNRSLPRPTESNVSHDAQYEADRAAAIESLGGNTVADRLKPERMAMLVESKTPQKLGVPGQSPHKAQAKKKEQMAPGAPPPRPIIPEGIELPAGEENWLDLWDLPDGELERRLKRAKRKAAQGRKEMRMQQQSGKAERKVARDERRAAEREEKRRALMRTRT